MRGSSVALLCFLACALASSISQPHAATGNAVVFVDQETPSGLIDGQNAIFGLTAAPNPPSSLHVYRNGILETNGLDYNYSGGQSFQFVNLAIPQPGDTLKADYRQ